MVNLTEESCIVTSADSNYYPALIALLRSLKKTNSHIPLVVFDGGLNFFQRKSASRFAKIIKKKPPIKIEGKGKFSYIGSTTLLKLEAASLPFKKVLYLDADTIVLDKLEEVFDFPEGFVGAVPEVNSVRNMFRKRDRELLAEQIDIEWERTGFNAGLFVLRPSEWTDLVQKARSLIKRFGEEVFSKSKDQQLLNIIFSGKVYDLPRRYNFSPLYDNAGNYRPAVLHYLSKEKPWHPGYPTDKYYKEFRDNITVFDHPPILMLDAYRKLKNEK